MRRIYIYIHLVHGVHFHRAVIRVGPKRPEHNTLLRSVRIPHHMSAICPFATSLLSQFMYNLRQGRKT